jgi:meiotically up-regulated gene 157 (Mug157) protein
MPTRRNFLLSLAAASAASARAGLAPDAFVSRRPAPSQRRFTSAAVEAKIVEVQRSIGDPELAWMFGNCFPNTLDTTVRTGMLDGKPDTFVITGDIDAMWLRDSSAQVWPYLSLAREDAALKRLLAGVIHRQTRCIRIDPYANAFNYGPTGSEFAKDLTRMLPELHERKWEIDSLCFPVRLAHGYWKATGDASCFDADWREAARLIVRTFREQQRLKDRGPYHFQRITPVAADTLPNDGYGAPSRLCGLIHSGFRPSDDACQFPFLIPANFFAARALEQLAEIHATELPDAGFAGECRAFANELHEALAKHGRVRHARHGEIYAYEVDGYGNHLCMDDANVPSLIALSYTGSCAADEPVYRNTRAFVLSDDDMYFFRGRAATGLGGPHSGMDMIWPLGIVLQAITSTDDPEIATCLRLLKATHAGTGFMHESFYKDDARKFTRKWFAWANTMFGELVLKLHAEQPALLA